MTDRAERWGWAAAFTAAAVAVWMDLSPIHRYHTSDSLVPVLSSLYKWTPFFWQQNRYGSLLPLLALPVEAPFWNLLLQVGLRLFAITASFFLLARTVVPRPYWPAVGALTLALWLGAKEIPDHAFLQMQPYGQAAALSLSALLLLDRPWKAASWRMYAGLGLLLLGFWISATTLFWLLPLFWVRHAVGIGSERDRARQPMLLAIVLAFGASLFFSWLSVYSRTTAFSAASPGDWPRAWRTLLMRCITYLSPFWVVAGIGLLAGIAVFTFLRRDRPMPRLALSAGLCLVASGLAELLIMGTTFWAQVNYWSVRYVTMELLALGMLLPALGLILLLEGRPAGWHRAANALALLVLLPVMALRYGQPSASRARAALDVFGTGTDEILEAGCTHVLGGYWRTWRAVFHADVVRWERGERAPVWGIAPRSGPTDHLWRPRDWRGTRIAVLADNEQAAEDMRLMALLPPLYLAEDRGDILVYTASSTGGPELSEVARALRNGLARPGPIRAVSSRRQ
jgi:hypothetical protein